jgi:ABC-2 type transport system ATP-binding protein
MSELAIETRGLTKVFEGNVVAVSGLDLAVERGTVCGLIGRNGAGKTTALRMLMGLLRADSGEARVLGEDMLVAGSAHRARVAYVSQTQRLHDWMTLGELSHYASHFYGKWDAPYAQGLATRFGLSPNRQVGWMSGGEQRKCAIAMALAARPEVLVLDEPAAGLDPIARRELIDELVDVLAEGNGTTVLLSTHIIADVERMAEHVAIMDRGRIVTSSRLDELQSTSKRVQVIFPGESVPDGFRVPGAVRQQVSGPVATAVAKIDSATALDEPRALEGVRVNVFDLGLEDIFIEIFGPESRAELSGEDVDDEYDYYPPARRGSPWLPVALVGGGVLLLMFLLFALLA